MTTAAGKAFVLALGLRVFYSLFAAVSSPFLELDPQLIQGNSLTSHLIGRASHPFLYALGGVWERFDTLWYVWISRHGYDSAMATVFYPLYPVLIRAISFAIHSDLAAALLISTVGSFFLFWGALRLFEIDYTPAVAFRAVLLWAAWPASFAFFAGYPDSLLCALVVWSMYFSKSKRWLIAGALGLLAGSTKALGCLTALPLLWIAWKQRERRGFIAASMCCIGFACFRAWLAFRHFPTAAEAYKTYWATTTVAPWSSLGEVASSLVHGDNPLLLLNFVVFACVAAAALGRGIRFEYKLYAAAAMCLFLAKHTEPLFQSTSRYSLAVFAAYPSMAARFHRGIPLASLIFVAAILNLLLFRTFLDWGLAV
jgi:hypothetical protein